MTTGCSVLRDDTNSFNGVIQRLTVGIITQVHHVAMVTVQGTGCERRVFPDKNYNMFVTVLILSLVLSIVQLWFTHLFGFTLV